MVMIKWGQLCHQLCSLIVVNELTQSHNRFNFMQKFLRKSHRKSESKEINDLTLHTIKLAKSNTPFTFLTKQNCNVRLSHNKSPPRDFICAVCKMREMNA